MRGRWHRVDGPAVIDADGTVRWWLDGYEIDSQTVDAWLKFNNVRWPFNQDQITHFVMRFRSHE